ncbi:phage/plasmid primase, P4 family [Faecalispora jeddahensis]|uniref:phage/plasmid primase, P4 family n=1 Tax=Faecalispora jeddahensis TaxID=1414721 RepID=UPI001FAD9894|nr:phage/plasmid primase, P4 family [Faecalispora jeddahensis]
MMPLYRGYIPTKDKKAIIPFKNEKDLYTLDQVQNFPEYAGVLADDAILIDVDDLDLSVALLRMVQARNLKCRVYVTNRGKHFLFKNSDQLVKRNSDGHTSSLAVGIPADIKLGSRNSYEVLKFANEERAILYDAPENEIQELPKWLLPLKGTFDFHNMREGDGRNQSLFNYILTLQDNGFTVEEARETIRLINGYVLKEPLSDRELETILRDESFQKPTFFKGRTFQHDKFATYLKNNNHIIKINGRLHVYQDGVYRADSEAVERAMVDLIPSLKDSQRKETLKQLNLICETKYPAPAHIIAFRNGIYNLADDSFEPFTPDVVITNKINWPYNPAAYNKLMDHTLDRIACGKAEIRALLEEMVGSCFYRSNALAGGGSFILTGEGANGKSTLLDALKYLLGDENIASLDLKELGDRFKTAELFGKLANIGDDIGSDYVANVATFRKLVTGQRVSAERKGQDPFEFDSYAKLLFSANAIPRLGRSKESYSIMRRLVIVPFDAKFTNADSDFNPNIRYDLQDQQAMEYLIRLGLDGLKRVLKNKMFTKSKDVEQAIESYRIENNPLLTFIEEIGATDIENEPVKAIYKKYKEFCLSNQFEPLNRIEFSRQVGKALNFTTKDKRVMGEKVKVFVQKVLDVPDSVPDA